MKNNVFFFIWDESYFPFEKKRGLFVFDIKMAIEIFCVLRKTLFSVRVKKERPDAFCMRTVRYYMRQIRNEISGLFYGCEKRDWLILMWERRKRQVSFYTKKTVWDRFDYYMSKWRERISGLLYLKKSDVFVCEKWERHMLHFK